LTYGLDPYSGVGSESPDELARRLRMLVGGDVGFRDLLARIFGGAGGTGFVSPRLGGGGGSGAGGGSGGSEGSGGSGGSGVSIGQVGP